MDTPVNGPKNQAMWERCDNVIPAGGIYMSRSARFAGRDVLPGFIKSAEGCRITDVDDRTYLDFNCGNGPNLLGYRHPEIDAAAEAQAKKMDQTSFFPDSMPTYAECLLEWGEIFDWVIFTKNGSDSTNLAMRIMRAARKKPYVILFDSAYHGFGLEIALSPENEFDANQRNILRVPWNDSQALLDLIPKCGDQVAGIMINPLDQNPTQVTTGTSPEIIDAINQFRSETGAYVTVDDVRNGFRLHPKGSHRQMGIEPDVVCLGKALANGYSTSAVLARNELREGAESIAFTATYMFSSVAFQAGMAMLTVYERDNVFDHITEMGRRLCEGITQAGIEAGHEDTLMSGPVACPTFLFKNDIKAKRARMFGAQASRLGAIFHPTANWFLSYAHKLSDIEEAIDIASEAFKLTPNHLE